MPLYEYECKKCHHRFERIQKFSDPLVRKCIKCKGRVEKLVSAPAVQFKGTGWYVTDYARKGSSGSDSQKNGEKDKGTEKGEKASGKSSGPEASGKKASGDKKDGK